MIVIPLESEIQWDGRKDFEEKLLLLSSDIVSFNFTESGGKISHVSVEMKPEAALKKDKLDILISEVARDFNAITSRLSYDTIFEHKPVVGVEFQDPHESLLANREIIENMPGEFVYQGNFGKALDLFDQIVKKLGLAQRCEEQKYPLLISTKNLFALNYFETMGQHIFIPLSPKGEYEAISKFTKTNSRANNKEKVLRIDAELCEVPDKILSPTVCYHCFSSLQNRTVASTGEGFSSLGRCFRNERSATRGLERLQTFYMREFIFVGKDSFIEEKFEAMLSMAKKLFAELLDLDFKISSAGDPFFGRIGSMQAVFQNAHHLKYELQVFLPYRNIYLACGSVNRHLSTMSKAFDFKLDSEEEARSMCLGFGYERILLALMAQKNLSSLETLNLLHEVDRKISA